MTQLPNLKTVVFFSTSAAPGRARCTAQTGASRPSLRLTAQRGALVGTAAAFATLRAPGRAHRRS